LDNRKNLIIIDEADELLNGSSGRFFSSGRNVEKGLINEILDKSQHICIWITNEYHHIDQSTRRRFDYSIEFAPLSIEARKCIWRNSLLKHGMGNSISTKDIELLSSKYNTSAGGINIALKNCMKLTKSKENSEILESIELLLKSHQEIMDASKIDKFFPGCENYSLEGLSVKSSLPLNKIIGIGRKFYFQRKSHFMANSNLKNINILLHGPPGTGKTEFARHLAEKLEKSLITKRGSDLLDIFVGGTEQNIRNSFRETENEDAILFIDEVDGLIADRGYASRNWEVTQVNELLGQMEDFKGILICATNFKSRMDSASIRRFALKIEFDWLDDKGKLIFFNRMLLHLSNSPLKNKEKELLKSINHLAPGDYRAVHQRFSFLDNECIKNIDLINALNEEVANKNSSHNSPIGFMK
jgi:SpoVK/Ycf46/Vps4 family AAA+-type ATPase